MNPKRSLTRDRPILDLPCPTPSIFYLQVTPLNSLLHSSFLPSISSPTLTPIPDQSQGSCHTGTSHRSSESGLWRVRPQVAPSPTHGLEHMHTLWGASTRLSGTSAPAPSIESVPSPDSCTSHIEHWWAVTSAYSFLPHTHTHLYTHTLSWCAEARSHQTADVNYQPVFKGLYLQSLPGTAVSPAPLCCSNIN